MHEPLYEQPEQHFYSSDILNPNVTFSTEFYGRFMVAEQVDLNFGAGGDRILLCMDKMMNPFTAPTPGRPVKDLAAFVMESAEEKKYFACPPNFPFPVGEPDPAQGEIRASFPVDLNSRAGGNTIYLCAGTEYVQGQQALTDIVAVAGKRGEKGLRCPLDYHDIYLTTQEMEYQPVRANLNEGTSTTEIYLCQKKAYVNS